ncbi:hypothetical protein U9M48_005650 [Paspalum notatum var. saurae]|uniref:H(+)/Pi cotransporter n=1 Tax=Paspalum notatum var. saurae TaxID=547442 RepID=A0AAQ3PMA8_PASNO
MLGTVPATLTNYLHMKMHETPRYTAPLWPWMRGGQHWTCPWCSMRKSILVRKTTKLSTSSPGRTSTVYFRQNSCIAMASTSLAPVCAGWRWTLTFYSLILFMTDIFTKLKILPALPHDGFPFKRMMKIAAVYRVIVLCRTLPGYFFTVAFVDRIGRVKIQLLGFSMMAVCILFLATLYGDQYCSKHKYALAFVYGITTSVAKIFPARIRSTCHGISGAFGKMGAIIGVFAFLLVENHIRTMLFILVACNLVGLVFTLLLPESKGRALEETTEEAEEQQVELNHASVSEA